jgi:hypothetical protein
MRVAAACQSFGCDPFTDSVADKEIILLPLFGGEAGRMATARSSRCAQISREKCNLINAYE